MLSFRWPFHNVVNVWELMFFFVVMYVKPHFLFQVQNEAVSDDLSGDDSLPRVYPRWVMSSLSGVLLRIRFCSAGFCGDLSVDIRRRTVLIKSNINILKGQGYLSNSFVLYS